MSGSLRDRIAGIPDQLETAPNAQGGTLPGKGRLLVGGMGGSAAAGDILGVLVGPEREVVGVREGSLPGPLRPGDVLLVLSYSGETEESLALWEEGSGRGIPCGAVASGGRLLDAATRRGAPRAVLPPGFPPRAALGHLLRGALALASPQPEPDWNLAARHLRGLRAGWVDATPGPARILADELRGRLPVVLAGDDSSSSAARRWVSDFAENAKVPALVWELPEAGHNRIMAAAREAPKPFPLALIALGQPERESSRRRWDATLAALAAHGANLFRVDAPHPEPWIHAMGLAYLGDWVSLLLGESLGVNVESLSLMNDLKARLAAGKEAPPR